MQKKNGVRFSDKMFMVLRDDDKVFTTKNSDRMIYMKPESVVEREKYKDKNVAVYRLEKIVSYEELKEELEDERNDENNGKDAQ